MAALPTDWAAFHRNAAHVSATFGDPAVTVANAGSLSQRWQFTAQAATEPNQPARAFDASPTVVGNRVYIGSRTGMFYALNATTGAVVWQKQLDWGSAEYCPAKGIVGTATVMPDPVDGVLTVYAPGAHFLYALNAATGAQRWKRSIGPNTAAGNGLYFNWSSPTVAGGRVFMGLAANCGDRPIRAGVVALNQHTGAWQNTWHAVPAGTVGASVWSSQASNGNYVWVTTGNPDPTGTTIDDAYSIVRLLASTLAKQDKWTAPLGQAADLDFGSSPTLFAASLGGVETPMVGACNKNGRYYAWRRWNLAAGPVWSRLVGAPGAATRGRASRRPRGTTRRGGCSSLRTPPPSAAWSRGAVCAPSTPTREPLPGPARCPADRQAARPSTGGSSRCPCTPARPASHRQCCSSASPTASPWAASPPPGGPSRSRCSREACCWWRARTGRSLPTSRNLPPCDEHDVHRRWLGAGLIGISSLLGSALAVPAAVGTAPAPPPATRCGGAPASPGWQLSTTNPDAAAAAPAYAGNGYVGTRVPAAGHGFVTSPFATDTHLAGVWADVPDPDHGGTFEQGGLNLPGWTRLDLRTGGGTYFSDGRVSCYRQTLDLRRGVVSTSAIWRGDDGRSTRLRYDVVMDRDRHRVGLVRLTFTPRWTGRVSIVDRLGDGFSYTPGLVSGAHVRVCSAARRRPRRAHRRHGRADRLRGPAPAFPTAPGSEPAPPTGARRCRQVSASDADRATPSARSSASRPRSTAGQRTPPPTVPSGARRAPALGSWWPRAPPRGGSCGAATSGCRATWRCSDGSGRRSSTCCRARGPTSTGASARSGLSSYGYNNHVFWDAETWMYPALLAQHPRDASTVVDYRYRTRDGARRNAERTGYAGMRFAWESALTGDEVTPTWAETRELEQHITADVALGQWQYYLATGDRQWLRDRGWPVLRGAATFWASRAEENGDGSFSINDIEGPDEHNWPVDDSVYTNNGAASVLRIAIRAAGLVGADAPARWRQVADGLRVLEPRPLDGFPAVRPEYAGYDGEMVKQADAVLLTYPWEIRQPRRVDRSTLDYYVPRYDPEGPAMTDSVNAIVASQLGVAGCASWTYAQRSLLPFVRGPYEQFTEARGGQGVFTFTTGEGGFLQEFLYGFPGLRWRSHHVQLNPSLPPQLADGLTVTGLHWHGRTFDVQVGAERTRVRLVRGDPMRVASSSGTQTVSTGAPISLPTRRPDQQPTQNVARCRPTTATAADISYLPSAAVDGSRVTSWSLPEDNAAPQSLTVDLGRTRNVDAAAFHWLTVPHTGYRLQVDDDGDWRTVLRVGDHAGPDVRRDFPATQTAHVRLVLPRSRIGAIPPKLGELEVLR